MVEERVEERGHGWEERGAGFLDRRHDIAQVTRVWDQCQRMVADETRGHDPDVSVDMEERHRQEHDVVPLAQYRAEPGVGLHRRLEQSLVAAKCRLWLSGRATGEEQQCRVVGERPFQDFTTSRSFFRQAR
jgi:hypothetical protein